MVETGPAPQAQEEPAKTPEVPSEADPVVNQEPVQSFEETAPEVTALKADADRRINEAPAEDYSDSDKQKVREALKLAKRLTRIATLQFGAGSTKLGNRERTRFKNALLTPEAEAILSDPQAVFFTIGYADATGTTQLNRQISKERATGVEALLKTFKVPNKCYSVGIGTTTLLSADLQSKNRAVEVWVVLP